MRAILAISVVALSGCQWIPGTDEHFVAEAEDLAAESLIDPTSAMFRKSKSFKYEHESGSSKRAVCGEINGKNRNGAYVGYTRFIASPEFGAVSLQPTLMYSEADRERHKRECTSSANERKRFSAQYEIAMMKCEQAKESAEEKLIAVQFEGDWASICVDGETVYLEETIPPELRFFEESDERETVE